MGLYYIFTFASLFRYNDQIDKTNRDYFRNVIEKHNHNCTKDNETVVFQDALKEIMTIKKCCCAFEPRDINFISLPEMCDENENIGIVSIHWRLNISKTLLSLDNV